MKRNSLLSESLPDVGDVSDVGDRSNDPPLDWLAFHHGSNALCFA